MNLSQGSLVNIFFLKKSIFVSDTRTGVSVRHGFKILISYDSSLQNNKEPSTTTKALVFCVRGSKEKLEWLTAFDRERKLVEQDLAEGLEFAPAARRLAREAASNRRSRPPNKHGRQYSFDHFLFIRLDSVFIARLIIIGKLLQKKPTNTTTRTVEDTMVLSVDELEPGLHLIRNQDPIQQLHEA